MVKGEAFPDPPCWPYRAPVLQGRHGAAGGTLQALRISHNVREEGFSGLEIRRPGRLRPHSLTLAHNPSGCSIPRRSCRRRHQSIPSGKGKCRRTG